MSDPAEVQQLVVDAFARLTSDITSAGGDADPERLRSVMAGAVRTRLGGASLLEADLAVPTRPSRVGLERVRETLLEDLATGDILPDAVLAVTRRDERETLLSGRLIDSATGLVPAERIGPFATHGGGLIWFDVYLPTQRMEVREPGAAAPSLVFTQARLSGQRRRGTTIDIEPGTVWVRGDLVSGALPASAFVGIIVAGGTLEASQSATVTGDLVELAGPLAGSLQLDLAAAEVTPAAGGCSSSQVEVVLPASLTFTFGAGPTATGTGGTAKAWGQLFDLPTSRGSWTFVEDLWTVVLAYDVEPRELDGGVIGTDVVRFAGVGDVIDAGLGLPVVIATNPAILGQASTAAAWLLQVTGWSASWYDADPRLHEIDEAWVALSAAGATILAVGVQPTTPPVTHTYDLWNLAGSDRRLPWRQTYRDTTSLFYRCHVVDGEYLLVQGSAEVALDRPVTTGGVPIPTPTGRGAVLLHRLDGKTTAMLLAMVEETSVEHQLALRNALVWTTAPAFVFVRGTLVDPRRIDDGTLQLPLGVHGWAPTLPDPYVSNAFVRRPRSGQENPGPSLHGRVAWRGPEEVTVSFDGEMGNDLALGGRETSSGEPRPARSSDGDPDVGLTQVEQDRLSLDRRAAAEWEHAQGVEAHGRGERREVASQEDAKSHGMIDGYMAEAVGRAPGLLLLDVSTNQDLLGVAVDARSGRDGHGTSSGGTTGSGDFPVSELAVNAQVGNLRVVTLPQVQWEPVRTLDADQDIMTMGWFPTPLASATDGGATMIGARSQKLMPVIPEDALAGTFDAYRDGTPVGIRTTFPFGLLAAIRLQPQSTPDRQADRYGLTRPAFPAEQAVGGIQITAHAEGGRPADGGISPMFEGRLRQLLNGVDLPSGTPLGISVLGSTVGSPGSVETIFNKDMASRPRVPVTRIDLSGYGGSNFSDWNNPFAAFAEAAKVQFRYMVGRTALEVIKINSVLHPWGIRVTRSVTIERRPGGGVIRRDSGWQAFTPGLFDYRYFDPLVPNPTVADILVADYVFDAGVFRGLFDVRTIRPAPGTVVADGGATLVPYYFDADIALEGVPGRSAAVGILGYLQTFPNGEPAPRAAIRALIQSQGPIGGPIEVWTDLGGSGLPFRAQRVEVGLAVDGVDPIFVATLRGAPRLPETGAWSVVVRPVASVPVDGGEAVTVAESRGVPMVRRYPVRYPDKDATVFTEPPLDLSPTAAPPGNYRFADAADLLTPAAPANEYALVQSTPTHAFLFPRPFVTAASAPRLESGHKAALADVIARSTSKGAFPPARNTIEMAPGARHLDVGATGKLALSAPITITDHPTPLRITGTTGHGSNLLYNTSTIRLELQEDRWEAEFSGLRIWTDIAGLNEVTGAELRIVGSTDQRPQIAEIRSLVLSEIEEILRYIPIFGSRGVQGPIDLGASNAKHELKVEVRVGATLPPTKAVFPAGAGLWLKLSVQQSTGWDLALGGPKASASFAVELEGKVPLYTVAVAAVFLIISGEVKFSLTSVTGVVKSEKLDLKAFVGVGVEGKIGPFSAHSYLGVGFVLVHDVIAGTTKYGGLVALEAGVELGIVAVTIRAELKGLVYDEAGTTKCDYSGSVKIQVDIFLVFSISATYQVSDTTTF